MAERKCGLCRETGHDRRKCPTLNPVQKADAVSDPQRDDKTDIVPPTDAEYDESADQREIYGNDAGMREPAWERPTAANVTLPPAAPDDASPRLLDTLKAKSRAAAGLAGLAGQVQSAADSILAPLRDDKTDIAPAIDAFLSPTPVGTPTAASAAVDAFLSPTAVTGQAGDEWRKKTGHAGYRIKLPETGEFGSYKNGNIRGVTRMTTFVHAASDSKGITDWNKRNVLLGAARKPELVAQAYGLDVTDDRTFLNGLVEQLEDAGGGNRASSLGTLVHTYTERLDKGEIQLKDVPPAYRPHLESYAAALADAGFEVIPRAIERTIHLSRFGGIVGTFDRALYHRHSDTYVMGDVKTGKDLKPGWSEIEAQEWGYAEGHNESGTYVWEEREADRDEEYWEEPEFKIRTDVGLVMWIPLVGPTAGTCQLLMTDLERGRRYAEFCADVRARRKDKGVPVPWAPRSGGAIGTPSSGPSPTGAQRTVCGVRHARPVCPRSVWRCLS